MSHNIYINITVSTEGDEFPNEHPITNELRREIKKIINKDRRYKLRRFNFDIIEDDFLLSEMEREE